MTWHIREARAAHFEGSACASDDGEVLWFLRATRTEWPDVLALRPEVLFDFVEVLMERMEVRFELMDVPEERREALGLS
jgi:hypothetical protein